MTNKSSEKFGGGGTQIGEIAFFPDAIKANQITAGGQTFQRTGTLTAYNATTHATLQANAPDLCIAENEYRFQTIPIWMWTGNYLTNSANTWRSKVKHWDGTRTWELYAVPTQNNKLQWRSGKGATASSMIPISSEFIIDEAFEGNNPASKALAAVGLLNTQYEASAQAPMYYNIAPGWAFHNGWYVNVAVAYNTGSANPTAVPYLIYTQNGKDYFKTPIQQFTGVFNTPYCSAAANLSGAIFLLGNTTGTATYVVQVRMGADGTPTITTGNMDVQDGATAYGQVIRDVVPGPDGFLVCINDNTYQQITVIYNNNLAEQSNIKMQRSNWGINTANHQIIQGYFYNGCWVVVAVDYVANYKLWYYEGRDPANVTWTAAQTLVGNSAGAPAGSYDHFALLDDCLVYIQQGTSASCYKTTNGKTWTAITNGTDIDTIYGGSYYNTASFKMKDALVGRYGGATSNLITDASSNNKMWKTSTDFASNRLSGMAYGNGVYVLAYNGCLFSSTDKKLWQFRYGSPLTSTALTCVTFLNGRFIVGGTGGVLLTSTDAVTWTARTSNLTGTILTADYVNGYYVVGGQYSSSKNVAYSTDATTWTSVTLGAVDVYRIAHINTRFVAATSNYLKYSDNAATWTNCTGGGIVAHCVYNDGSQLVSANDSYVLTSSDGATFTTQLNNLKWSERFNGNLFVSDIYKFNGAWYFWSLQTDPINNYSVGAHTYAVMNMSTQLNLASAYAPSPVAFSGVAFNDYGFGPINVVNGVPTILFPLGYYELFNTTPAWVGTKNKVTLSGLVGYVRIA